MPTKRNNSRGNRFYLFWVVGCLVLALQLVGCGGASPPAGIPAPVSNLITLEGPDSSGTVSVIAAPGAVLGNATVKCGNITEGGQVRWWSQWLLRAAVAETHQYEQEVIAASNGSFQMQISAESGDTLRMVQIVDDATSPPTDLIVP